MQTEEHLENTNTHAFRVSALVNFLYPLIDRLVAEMYIIPDINSLPGNT